MNSKARSMVRRVGPRDVSDGGDDCDVRLEGSEDGDGIVVEGCGERLDAGAKDPKVIRPENRPKTHM